MAYILSINFFNKKLMVKLTENIIENTKLIFIFKELTLMLELSQRQISNIESKSENAWR